MRRIPNEEEYATKSRYEEKKNNIETISCYEEKIVYLEIVKKRKIQFKYFGPGLPLTVLSVGIRIKNTDKSPQDNILRNPQ